MNVLISIFKLAIRAPLDFSITALMIVRSLVRPKTSDSAFASNHSDLKGFTFTPGDVVILSEFYGYLSGSKDLADLSPDNLLIGSVVGYNLKARSVIVSYLNAAELGNPILKSVKEVDLKLLKSPMEELIYQAKLHQSVQDLSDLDFNPRDVSDLTADDVENMFNELESFDVESGEINEEDDDDDEDNGGGYVH